ncbi:MAG TPA: zf-HC2 domain-containing protein [Candidatus Binataceae bacterium]|jgi:hypothetical protein|nr:zf-HC2 domain-containing protein [Candidatus Binataceae bacterium]
MNCFEARPQFVDFWRGTLDAEQRAALVAHLKECAKCDRGFRAFALTAPMLHPRAGAGAPEQGTASADAGDRPMDTRRAPRADAVRAAEIIRRAAVYQMEPRGAVQSWGAIASALSAVAAAVLLAWVSVTAPPQSLEDALGATQEVTTSANNPLLGQPMPEIPNDLVG